MRRQRGAVAVMAALMISTVVILLASVDIGFLFYQKRELQKVADMAAIAGAQQLARAQALPEDRCASVLATAANNARTAHGFVGVVDASCGKWDPATVPAAPHYLLYTNGTAPSEQPPPSAVRVSVTRSFGSFFGAWAAQQVHASAVAVISTPTAVFSVESMLLNVEGGAVPALLKNLGVDVDGTALVTGAGLANAKITTAGLLKELGFNIPLDADVATLKSLISAGSPDCSNGYCPLSTLLDAIGAVGGQEYLVDVLGLTTGQIMLPVKLLTDETGHGLFTILDAANGKSALEANINAPELLSTALSLANGHKAAETQLATGIDGVISADTRLGLLEPASIGIGGVGTAAYTSQVRLFTQLRNGNPGLLELDLPLAIDLTNGTGTIEELCEVKDNDGNDTALIKVEAPIFGACVGGLDHGTAFLTTAACGAGLANQKILDGILPVTTNLSIKGSPVSGTVRLSKGQEVIFPPDGSSLAIGTVVKNLTDAVMADVLGKLLLQGQGNVTENTLAGNLLAANANNVQTALATMRDSIATLKTFTNGLSANVTALLEFTPDSGVVGTLNGIDDAVTGLLASLGSLIDNLIGNVLHALGCLTDKTQCITGQLAQNGGQSGGISNVLVTILGLVTQLLQPILDNLSTTLTAQLESLLGAHIGQVKVKLIDLNCGGGENVRLVH